MAQPLRLTIFAACATLMPAFHLAPARMPTAVARGAGITMMPSEATIAKKAAVVDELVVEMEKSMLMFCVRSEGIKPNEMNAMRQKYPEDVTIRCAKNTLVKLAAEKVPKMQGGDALLKRSNYWFFVPEENLREAFTLWDDYVKETKKEELEILGAMFDGQLLSRDELEAITKLPTKQELMGQTAGLLKAMPQKLARLLNEAGAQRVAKVTKQASGQKLVQAIKQVEMKMEK